MHISLHLPLCLQVFLSLVLALNRLAKAASDKAQESRETVITPRHITSVAAVSQPHAITSSYMNIISISFLGCSWQFERIILYLQ